MNIKILLCFIIMCSIPVASASNILWTAKSSGFIGGNDSLSFETYLVKATYLDDLTSSISVFKNNVLIGTDNFRPNEFKNYDNITITLLGIKGKRSWVSISKLEDKDFWRFFERTQLNWGESYTIENETFMIDTYGKESVNISISNRRGTEKKEFFIGSEKYFDTFMMRITNINRTGFIDIDFFTNRLPDYKTEIFPFVKAELYTNKDEYFPDEPVQVSVKISNDLKLNIVGITVESGIGEITPWNFSMIDVSGENILHSIMSGQTPNSTGSIEATIEMRDYSGNSNILKVSKDISITPEVAIIKRVQADTDDENVPVQLYVHNSGSVNRSVHVHDRIPEELTEKSLDWDIYIDPGSYAILEYNVTPPRMGLYFLPPATVQWDGGGDVSKKVKMMMHMPYILMEKSIELKEGNTLVKLTVTNSGDRPAQVNVSDNVPPGHQVLSGSTIWSGKLESGDKTVLSYYLEGDVKNLPDAEASYLDIRGVTRHARSNTIVSGISVAPVPQENKESTKPLNVAPSDLVIFMISSFMAIAGVVTGGATIAYLIAKTLR